MEATKDKQIICKDPVHLFELARSHGAAFHNVIDADAVAKDLGWTNRSFDGYCANLIGKNFCLRGSALPTRGRPSEVALQHEKMRVLLLHEFAKRYRKDIGKAQVSTAPTFLGKRKRPH